MPAQLPALDPDGRWVTANGAHVHIDSDGTPDAGAFPGFKTGNPIYDGFGEARRRDLGPEPKLPKALRAHAKAWAYALSPDELSQVGRYTNNGYKAVNGAAKRCPETLDCLGLREYHTYRAMQSAIAKAGPLPHPVVAYRGFRSEPASKEALLRAARAALYGKHPLTLPGFQSLSLDPSVANQFAGMTGGHERDDPSGGLVFEVVCTSGAPVGWSDDASMYGDAEKELVLNHNSKFKVTGIEYNVPFGSKGHARHTVVRLEQADAGSTVAPKDPTKAGWRGTVQKIGAAAADLVGLSADDIVLSAESLRVLAPIITFAGPPPFPPKPGAGKPPFPPKGKGKVPFPPKGAKPGVPGNPPQAPPPSPAAGSDVPLALRAKKHVQTVEKHKEDLAGDLPDHGNGPVSANEKHVRDTHKKIGDHLAKRAMSGQWGPAEDGLQRMHEHLTGVLAQHDQHHAQKHSEAEQLAHHEEDQKADEEATQQAAVDAANAPPPEPDVHPAQRLAMEARARRKKRREKKAKKAERLVAGRDKNRPDLAGLPASVRVSIASKHGEAPPPKVLGDGDETDDDEKDDEKGKKGKKGHKGKNGFGSDGEHDEHDEHGDKDGDNDGDKDGDGHNEKSGHGKPKLHGHSLDVPSTEEQANAVLPYKVKLRVPLAGPYGLTTDTNSGVDHVRLTKKVREAADPAAAKDRADPRGGGTRAAAVRRVAKVLARPLSSGEAELVDPARPGVLTVRPDGSIVKETRAGTWITPDRFAPPEFVPHAAGLMPGSYGYDSYGPAVAGAETGSGAVRDGSPGAPRPDDRPPDHGVTVGYVGEKSGRLYVPLGPDHRPLTHQHFTDRRTADLVGKATATGAARSKLHFDRPKREWCLLHLHPTRGWVERDRFKEKEEAKAEHHLRRALHADLDAAGQDAGVVPHAPPALPHGVGTTRVGPDTLYHASGPDGGPVGDLYHERETAELAAHALTRGVCETRLRHDGDKWVIETATGHGWRLAKSYPDHRPKAAEKHFRKKLRHDLDRDAEGHPDPEKEAGAGDLDGHFNKGYKRAKRAGKSAGDGSDLAPALHRHAAGVVQSAYAKLRARFGDQTARAIAAAGFAQETHGAGLGKRKDPAAFAGGAGAKGDLDPSGRWVTIAHNKCHTDGKGGLDAGGPAPVREALGGKGGGGKPGGKPGAGGGPIPTSPASSPAAPPAGGGGPPVPGAAPGGAAPGGAAPGGAPAKAAPTGRGNKGKHATAGKPVAPPGGSRTGGWGSWLAGLAAGAAVAHVRKKTLGGPTIRGPQDRAPRGGSGRGGSGSGKGRKGGKGGGGGAGQHKFNKAALIASADFLKKVQTGGVDTTGHGNTAVNIGFSADAPAVATFGFLDRKKKYRLSDRHIKALGRIFMEEVRGAMTRAALTRQDLHAAQDRHAKARAPKSDAPAAFDAGASLAARVREGPGSVPAAAARALVAKFEAIVPPALLRESRVRDLEIYPDQTGTQRRADETQREGVQGVRGFFDRHAGLMVVSVVGSDCHNFYHELGHSFDHLLTDADKDRVAVEWGGTHPENFAEAFTALCMALRAGRAAARAFGRNKPAVCTIVARHGLAPAAFSADPRTRVARARCAAAGLAADLAALAVTPTDYRAGRRAAGVRVADAVSEFAAAVAPAAPPRAAMGAVGAFAAAAAALLDALDDVTFAAAGGHPSAAFAETFADLCGGLAGVAVGAAAGLADTLPPAVAARELLAAAVFGWQDEVRDAQGKWSKGGGSGGGEAGGSGGAAEGGARPVEHPPGRVRALIEAEPDRANLPPRDQLPDLPPPPTAGSPPAVVGAWAKKVAEHPYIKEAERLVQAAKDAGATTGNLHWDPDAEGGKGDFTPERKKIHDEIAAHVLNPGAAAAPGERPQVAFVLGPPGSGKTSMGRPAARAAMGLSPDRVTTLDPDEVKMSLPEYKGWNAALVHDESAEVFDRLLEKAVADKHHVVFDTTGRSEEFMTAMLDKFSKAGYDAHLVHTHLSGEQSAKRAVDRFVKQAFTDSPDPDKRGRYVPVGFIAQHIDGHPERVYDKLREDPRVKSWVSYDANDMASGKIRNSGTRPQAESNSAAA